jgi:hypothetical protein
LGGPGFKGINQLPSQYFSQGLDLLQQVPNPFFGKIPSTNLLGGATISQGQLLRPYPQFFTLNNGTALAGDSSYQSVQASLQRRFGAGGVLVANYTWSKLLGDVDTPAGFLETSAVGTLQNLNDLRAEKSLVSFDTPHRLTVSYVLDLPIGKGKWLLGNLSGAVGKLVSGWGVNGIYTAQSGFPLAINAQANFLSSLFGAGTIRPNVVAGCEKKVSGSAQSRLAGWFNTACFAQPGQFSFGNESRVDPQLRIQGINNVDFSVTKTTTVTERVNLQFRTEFFNLFNRVQFGAPGATLGLPTFGKVSSQNNQPRLVQFALRLQF